MVRENKTEFVGKFTCAKNEDDGCVEVAFKDKACDENRVVVQTRKTV